jgi:hypothetical protein
MGRPPRDRPHDDSLQDHLRRLGRYLLIVVVEVGYIPFKRLGTSPSNPNQGNLFFQLVSSRYERASLIVTANKPIGRWGEVFGDDVVAAAMIDRLVHHAEVIALKGDSYRLRNRDLGRVPATHDDHDQPCPNPGVHSYPSPGVHLQLTLTAWTSEPWSVARQGLQFW